MEHLRKLARILLDPAIPASTLRPEVVELMDALSAARVDGASAASDISDGETRTADGLALSPTMAQMCVSDFVRTIEFLRGTHAAIDAAGQVNPGRPIRVLYAGCGPFATLATPLMTVMSPGTATFALLDIHPESTASVRTVIESLGLGDWVTTIETTDAGSYRVDPAQVPDVVLMEIMQAALEAEPQVAVARHLMSQAPEAILVPESVRVDLALVDPAREFDPGSEGPVRRDRIAVGPLFTLDRETIASWTGLGPDRLPAAEVRLQEAWPSGYTAMLLTTIRVHGDHRLRDYDSGLTCPRVLAIEGGLRPGDTVRFHYALGAHPQLVGRVVPSA